MAVQERIEKKLREKFAPSRLEIADETFQHYGHAGKGAGGHFQVTIVSSFFSGMTAVDRHRAVYDALREEMKEDIHALKIKALAPEESR